MKKSRHQILYWLFFVSIAYYSCQTQSKDNGPLTALETAQQFIRCEMNGEFNGAQELMLLSEFNLNELNKQEKEYQVMSDKQKKQLKTDIINIKSYDETSDSTAIMIFSNISEPTPQSIKLILRDKKWLVDLQTINIQR